MSSHSVFTWKMGSRFGIYAGNFNSKMANDVNIIAVVFFSALSALIHLNTCMKLLILQKVTLRKKKLAMLFVLVFFRSLSHSGMSFDSCSHGFEGKFRSGLKSRFGMRLGSNSIRIEL
jgi:hypothetical protein